MTLPAPPVSSSDNPAVELTDTQKEEATKYLDELKKRADYEAWQWMANRVPPAMQKMFLEANPEPENPDAPKPVEAPPAEGAPA